MTEKKKNPITRTNAKTNVKITYFKDPYKSVVEHNRPDGIEKERLKIGGVKIITSRKFIGSFNLNQAHNQTSPYIYARELSDGSRSIAYCIPPGNPGNKTENNIFIEFSPNPNQYLLFNNDSRSWDKLAKHYQSSHVRKYSLPPLTQQQKDFLTGSKPLKIMVDETKEIAKSEINTPPQTRIQKLPSTKDIAKSITQRLPRKPLSQTIRDKLNQIKGKPTSSPDKKGGGIAPISPKGKKPHTW
ncbi:MAG TPA: hypothetical protein QF353_07035 [Gammaproteobacteria bacterium]|nr:hypothetical protein [Gammaproteobacteria bacterium]